MDLWSAAAVGAIKGLNFGQKSILMKDLQVYSSAINSQLIKIYNNAFYCFYSEPILFFRYPKMLWFEVLV